MDNLTGIWVGETIGGTTPLHRWVIVQRGHVITIYTRYSLESRFARFEGTIAPDGQYFTLIRADGVMEIPLDNQDEFTVPGWVYKRKGKDEWVPMYDVFFRRRDKGMMQWLMWGPVQLSAGTPRLMELIG